MKILSWVRISMLGWLIPIFMSSIYFAPYLLGDLKYKEGRKIIVSQNILFSCPLKRGGGGVSAPKVC